MNTSPKLVDDLISSDSPTHSVHLSREEYEAKIRADERQKVLELLVDEDSFELSRSCIDDGNDFSGDIFLRVEAKNQLRDELRQQIKEMG